MVAVNDLLISQAQFGVTAFSEKTPGMAAAASDFVSGALEEKQKRDADAFNVEAETQLRLFGAEAIEQSRVEAKNPEEITRLFFDKYKTKRDELYANAPSGLAKEGLDLTFNKLKATYGQAAINTQVSENQKFRVARLQNSIDDIATSMRNGGDYNGGMEAFESIYAQSESFTSAADREEMRPKFMQAAKAGRLDFLFESGQINEVDRLIKDSSFNSDLTVEQVDSYRTAVARQRENEGVDADLINYLANGEGYIDPSDKKVQGSINRIYKANIKPALLSGDSAQAGAAYTGTINLIEKTGVVPDDLSGMLRSAYFGTGADKDLAYRFIEDINLVNPRVIENVGIKDNQVNEAMLYNQLKADGVQEKDLQQIVQAKIYPADKATAERRQEELKKEFKDNKKTFDITNMFDEGVFDMEPGIVELPGASVNKQQQLQQRFRDLYEGFYMATGDSNLAEKRATEAFKRNHGVTKVTGSKYLTDYPPENYYRSKTFEDPGLGDLTSEWMRLQLEEKMSVVLNKKISANDLMIVADGITAQKVKSKISPDYQVYVQSEDEGLQYIGRVKWDLQKAIKDRKAIIEGIKKKKKFVKPHQKGFTGIEKQK